MKIRILYCLMLVFCMSQMASSKNCTVTGKTGKETCKTQPEKAVAAGKEAADDSITELPVAHLLLMQV